MNRRTFVGAIAALMAAPKALAAAVQPNRGVGPAGAYIPAPLTPFGEMLAGIERKINRAIEPHFNCRLELRKNPERYALTGIVTTTRGQRLEKRFSAGLRPLHFEGYLPPDAQLIRQIKYQTMKAVGAIEFTRRTGFAEDFDSPDGRIRYRHLATGRYQYEHPE